MFAGFGGGRDRHGEVRDPLPRPEVGPGQRLRQDGQALPHEGVLLLQDFTLNDFLGECARDN